MFLQTQKEVGKMEIKISDLFIMGWSKKYKKSIDCNNPKGFSQKTLLGRKKRNEEIKMNIKELVKTEY